MQPSTGAALDEPREDAKLFRLPGFAAYWTSSTVSGFGSSITAVAIPVLVVTTLAATPVEVGIINAVQSLPYLLFGLVVGVLVDRRRRKPTLVVTSVASCLLLLVVPALWITDTLSLWALAVLLFLFGVVGLMNAASSQSFLPRLVPRSYLLVANARLDQSATVAQSAGPAIGGALVSVLTAPIAVLVDAVSYGIEAVLVGRIRIDEPRRVTKRSTRHLLHDIRDGVTFTYRHRMLAPLAWSTHVWFLANAIAFTVFAPFALRSLGVNAFGYGLALACAGVGGVVGASLATRVGNRIGAGKAVIAGRAVMPIAWIVVAVTPPSTTSGIGVTICVVAVGEFIYGFSMGIENANEMGYWQAVMPDEMQGRINATRRSANRTMFLIGSLAGGALATWLGYRPALWIAVGIFLIAVSIVGLSPFAGARHDDEHARPHTG
jgi:MFS family permease